MKKVKIIPITEKTYLGVNIEKATRHIPDWYKKSSLKIKGLEKFYLSPDNPKSSALTYKGCSPFLDALSNGYIFYLSQDVEVTIQENGSPYIMWRTDDVNPPIRWHTNEQWDGLVVPEHFHKFVYKFENSFIIKTPKKYSTLFTHPMNRFDLPFQTISGIVDTDKYNIAVNFPFFLKENFTGIIKAGTPVVQIMFFKRETWFRKIKKYNEKFIRENYLKFFSNIDRSYKKMFWQKKDYL